MGIKPRLSALQGCFRAEFSPSLLPNVIAELPAHDPPQPFACALFSSTRRGARLSISLTTRLEVVMSTLNDTFFASDIAWLWFSKVAGSIAGAIISLFYMPPHGRREAAARFVVGIICGIVFGGAASVKITKALALEAVLGRTELMLIGSTSASLASWSALGVCKRFSERLKNAALPGILPSARSSNGEAGCSKPNAHR